MRKYIFIWFTVLLCSCIGEDMAEPFADSGSVTVSMDFSLDDGFTKSVNDPAEIVDVKDVVKNLWIIQYNGTSGDSQVLGEPTYIEDFASFDGKVQLMVTDKPCTICFVANTFEGVGEFPVHQRSTLAELNSLRRMISRQYDMLGAESADKYHVMFNGSITPEKVDRNNTGLSGVLRRNIAKASINILNNSGGKVKISSLQLCSVPSVSYYMSNPLSLEAPYPTLTDFNKVNYDAVTWTEGASSMTLNAYIPVNMRGTSVSTTQSDKNRYAPDGSTYLLVTAVYLDDGQEYPVTYTFFLGENMINDYNLVPNKSYDYTFTISSEGNADSDYRVTDWGLVDFTDTKKYPLANSYILNPMPLGDFMRHFRIPITRITEFWGGKDGYEDSDYEALKTGDKSWRCFVLASDFPISDENFRIIKGNGIHGTDDYFEVSVAAGVSGNVIVAVGPANDNAYTVSWSWHLWITDYDPYPALEYGAGKAGQYIYPATNGSVHRYAGSYWDSNASKYIMDRNLGALSAIDYPSDNRGFLYYQFGRKDPFFALSGVYVYPAGGHYTFKKITADEFNTNNAVIYSVKNPMSFALAGVKSINEDGKTYHSWVTGNVYKQASVDKSTVWMDPNTVTGGKNAGKKSVFDPCPPGYRVPHKDIWSDFSYNAGKETVNAQRKEDFAAGKETVRGFSPFNTVKGLLYWPYGTGDNVPSDLIYIPANGYLNHTSSNLVHHGNITNDGMIDGPSEWWSFLWSQSPNTDVESYGYTAQPNHLAASNKTMPARGCPVRCITDN